MEALKEYNPQMHTAEHILNQTMVRMFNCERSFNNHIEKKKSKCDFNFPRPLTESEITELELRVNDIIKSELQVTSTFHKAKDAVKLFKLKKPQENDEDIIRIIHIGNYDSCPCIGNHVDNTSEIVQFRIISTSWENNILRIRFKAGQ